MTTGKDCAKSDQCANRGDTCSLDDSINRDDFRDQSRIGGNDAFTFCNGLICLQGSGISSQNRYLVFGYTTLIECIYCTLQIDIGGCNYIPINL